MTFLNAEWLAKRKELAEGPTLGNLHPDARAQAIARAGIADAKSITARIERDYTADEVRRMLADRATEAGSQKSLARTLDVSEQYLSDVLLGRRELGPAILSGLGLEAVVSFRPLRLPDASATEGEPE